MLSETNKRSYYRKYLTQHNYEYPHCTICGKVIALGLAGSTDTIEVIKSKRNTTIFVHKTCYKSLLPKEETI